MTKLIFSALIALLGLTASCNQSEHDSGLHDSESPQSTDANNTSAPPESIKCIASIWQDWNDTNTLEGETQIAFDIEIRRGEIRNYKVSGIYTQNDQKTDDLELLFLRGSKETLQVTDFSKFILTPQIIHYSGGDWTLEVFLTIEPRSPNVPVGIRLQGSRNQGNVSGAILLNQSDALTPSPISLEVSC